MKNTKLLQIVCLIGWILSLISCESFIEVDAPQSQLIGANAFNEVATATAALSDIYAQMRENGMVSGLNSGGTSLMGIYADELDFYGTNTQIMAFNNHTLIPSNTLISGLWNTTYGQIYSANALLEGVKNSAQIKEEDRNRLLGEALFIRAYLHFYLLNIFGEIPYVTTTDYTINTKIRKLDESQLYQNVIADLNQARRLLPETYHSEERVRPNKSVVTAMLARVYLYSEDWVQAEAHATAVLENPLYTWEENLSVVFLKDSRSTIWSLHAGIAGLNTKDARTFVFTSGPPIKPALSLNLMNAFESGDLRKNNWTRTILKGAATWAHAYKYKKTTNTVISQEYTILLRLAEQYIIRSEARVHNGNLSGAQDDLNKIRNRAGLANTSANTPAKLIDAIIQERRVELFLEQGHRWFDLKRTDKADAVLSVLKPEWKSTQVVLPLPESELLLNENLLPQNAGY